MFAVSDTSSQPKVQPAVKKLVLFDFDGTITARDTLAEFMIYYHGRWKYLVGLAILSPVVGAYLLKLMPNWKSKQMLLSWFLKEEVVSEFERRCKEFANHYIPRLIRPDALKAIAKYKEEGATIAVVSASAENWVKPWCDLHGLICLATKLEEKENKITGRILGKNCHGPEKVCRITERFNLAAYNEIIAYGDSSGDTDMLNLAHKKYFKPFRK